MYDIIGDIHGERVTLEALLTELGYRRGTSGWSHGDRKAVFAGDFIDRGPDSRGVCELVREMVESGSALAVMGNHELNAIAFHTEDPDHPGEHLRRHSEKNVKQHEATLRSYAGADAALADTLGWFATLPMWLELEGLRVVHAAWHEASMETLSPYVSDAAVLHPAALVPAARRGHEAYRAAETVLKGVEIPLPGEHSFRDKDGHLRREVRVRWWATGEPKPWREVALGPPDLLAQLPDETAAGGALVGYAPDAAPVFFGHYWLTGQPRPLAPNVACLDYSVARPGGKLVAYRWDGEHQLREDRFEAVPQQR
jgi:hypothetical protein